MLPLALYSLASVLLVSVVSLVGLVTLGLKPERVRRLAVLFVAFAVGALLGDSFIHLIPESFESRPALVPSLSILGGILLFFVVEKLLRRHHGVIHGPAHHHQEDHRPEVAAINILGDAVHNFIDGILISASYLASPELGVSTTIAVLLHEIPQELGDFGILVHSGLSVQRAILVNVATATTSILGALLTLVAGSLAGTAVTAALLPVTAGGFVYLAAADLIPELHHDRSSRSVVLQTSLILLGIGIMALLTLVD